MAVLCFIGFCGAVTAAGISGHVAVYIMKNRDDVNNTICHPEEYYPPVFTQEDADEDCKLIKRLDWRWMRCDDFVLSS